MELMEVVIHQKSNGNPNLLEFIISPGINESSAWPEFDGSAVTATVSSGDRTGPDKREEPLIGSSHTPLRPGHAYFHINIQRCKHL